MTTLVQTLQLRYVAGANPARKVTWLELFFDLIFVAAVAQVGEPLREDYSFAGIARFSMLFALIWWAWIGNSVFATRFDTDDALQRVLTFVQMFAVAAMAANASAALDSRDSAGFAAAYAAVRVVLVIHYARARAIESARALATRYLVGHPAGIEVCCGAGCPGGSCGDGGNGGRLVGPSRTRLGTRRDLRPAARRLSQRFARLPELARLVRRAGSTRRALLALFA